MGLKDLLTPERVRFIRFCVVGGSGVFVNLGFVWIGVWLVSGLTDANLIDLASLLGLSQEADTYAKLDEVARSVLPSVLGIVVSVFGNFILNSIWTWGDRERSPGTASFLNRLFRYYLASGAAIAIQLATAQSLTLGLGLNLYLGQSAGILLGTVVNFLANNRWTFGQRTETAPESPSVEG